MGFFEGLGTTIGGAVAAKKNRKEAVQNRNRNMNYVGSIDWTPQYAQNLMSNNGAYQKSESPLARSYLESLLTGNNPDATFSGSPNADLVKTQQAGSRDQMYGTQQQLQQRSQQNATTNPYQSWTPDDPRAPAAVAASRGPTPAGAGMNDLGPVAGGAPGGGAPGQTDDYKGRYPLLAGIGVTADEHQRLIANGVLDDWQDRDATQWGVDPKHQGQVNTAMQTDFRRAIELMDAGDVKGAQGILRGGQHSIYGGSSKSGRTA